MHIMQAPERDPYERLDRDGIANTDISSHEFQDFTISAINMIFSPFEFYTRGRKGKVAKTNPVVIYC